MLTLTQLSQQIELLMENGVDREILLTYPWVISMNPSQLELKLSILREMKPRSINDYIPLLNLTAFKLAETKRSLWKEANRIPDGAENRLYYLADKLNIAPHIVSNTFVNYPFLIDTPLRLFIANLDVLLNFKVAPENILRDPWVFNYSSRKTRARLERAKNSYRPKLMPWMARCPMKRLNKSLQLTIDSHEALSGCNSLIEYLSKRLDCSEEKMAAYMTRHPAALKVRVTKIKAILDYLLDEAKFDPVEVANVPRVLCSSLDTLKARVEELKKLGIKQKGVMPLCFAKKDYDSYLRKFKRRGVN